MAILSFDIGGSSVKYAVIEKTGKILAKGKKTTPQEKEEFFRLIENVAASYRRAYTIEGAGFSFPGAVDDVSGVIGGSSALPYIHDFPIRQELERRLSLPAALENDANCAALGESWLGVGKEHEDLVFLVIGTGIGGAVVKGKRIHHGKHLHGGEFGYMVSDASHRILSETGSTRVLAERVADAKGLPREEMDGRKAFALADAGDADALQAVSAMYEALAMAIYNLQYAIDPEIFVLGGAVSERPGFAEEIGKRVDVILKDVGVARIRPVIRPAQFGNDANLLGAVRALLNKQDR
ncbi:ROK family protein [uncultured Selenomonas sp.]|uniref:ROK family protein n=1 Tax=uncultured Selenomonas sp. TaxID=159275 RepID=UPI002803A22E|nr:ROK family protein [uncultured Selenomonas sp.]